MFLFPQNWGWGANADSSASVLQAKFVMICDTSAVLEKRIGE